jgi:hypothetical protein
MTGSPYVPPKRSSTAKTGSKARAARIRRAKVKPSARPERSAAAANRQTKPRAATGQSARLEGGRKETTRKGKPEKVIRDSFTMPVADYELLGVLKRRCIGLGVAIKKSELLRAGLAALERLPDESLAGMVAAVESVKTGRPPGKKKRKKKKNRAKGGKR